MSIWFSVAPHTIRTEDEQTDSNREQAFARRRRPRNLGEFLRPIEATEGGERRDFAWAVDQATC